jgi:hypothetical protein
MSIENTAGMNDQERRVNVASEAAGRVDFGPAADFNISKDLAVNFNLTHPDVRMNDGIATNNQGFTAVDGAVKITVDPDDPRKLKFASEIGSLIEKRRDLLFLITPNLHCPPPSKLRSNETFIKPVHFFK